MYFPGTGSVYRETFVPSRIEDGGDFILKSGQALIYPICKSTYERRDDFVPYGKTAGLHARSRDHVVACSIGR